MDELNNRASLIDYNGPYDVRAHQDIYNLNDALPPQDAFSEDLLPDFVFYCARNILLPTFIIGQIPDLLNLLTLVETFRQFALAKSDEALEWHTFYERAQSDGREQGVRLLAANEVRVLKGFLNRKDAQRREYIVLVRSLILLYIHYLWTAPESCLMWKRFNDFFPRSIEGYDGPSELLIHVDLSEDENAYVERLKVECQEWLKLVADWDSKEKNMFREEGIFEEDLITSFSDEFRDAFPPPCEPSDMARNVEIYMKKVENMVRKLEQWFPPSSEV